MSEEKNEKWKRCPKCDSWIPENYTTHLFSKKLNKKCGWNCDGEEIMIKLNEESLKSIEEFIPPKQECEHKFTFCPHCGKKLL